MIKDRYKYSKQTTMYYFFGMLFLLVLTSITCYFIGRHDALVSVQKLDTDSFTVIDSVIYTGKDGLDYLIIISEGDIKE